MSETRETLVHKKGITKRRITNLLKKINPLCEKEEWSSFDIVCAKHYLDEILELDRQYQQHLEASALLDPSNHELNEKDVEELEMHEDRVWETTSNFCMS